MFRVYKLKRDEKGQAMVEFALIFVIVVMIALAIAQFSMILSAQIAVTNAAREGARAASVGSKQDTPTTFTIDGESVTLDSVYNVVDNAIDGHPFLNSDGLTVVVSPASFGNPVKVKVAGVFVRTIVPIPSFSNFSTGSTNIVDSGVDFPLTAEASMRLERE